MALVNYMIYVKTNDETRIFRLDKDAGEAIPIGERRVATFHASAKLKEQIQNGGGAEEASDTGSTEIEVWRVGAE